MAIETLHVRESHVPGLTARDLEEGSFYELLLDRYGIVIVGGTQTIEPTVTDEEESEALGVPLHSPAFRFERITQSEGGEIVEFVESIYRGDRYRLVTALGRPQEHRRRRRPAARVAELDGRAARAARG
jgi:GntR family transcriptional regulator